MSLNTLDRTQWSYAAALEHVQSVTVARRGVEAASQPAKPQVTRHLWGQPQDPTVAWKTEAENGGEKVGHGSGGMSPLRAAQ